MKKKEPWGFHLILNIAECNENVTRKTSIYDFVKQLLKDIDMVPYGAPVIEHFAEHTPSAAGYSLLQLIETSAICGHFSDQNKDAYIDIFSCKGFDPDLAIETVRYFFEPKTMHFLFLEREAKEAPVPPFKNVNMQ